MTAQNADVYVVGKEGNNTYKLWENEVETVLTTYGYANSVFVSDNDVYVAGAGVTTTVNGLRHIARIWKNGEATFLSDGTNFDCANSVFIVDKRETGMGDIRLDSYITSYPNPVKDVVYINSPSTVQQVVMYNISGDIVLQQENVENGINVSTLPQGVYVLKLVAAEGEVVRKIVKK